METFYWSTENYHCDNNETMNDYLENHLPEDFSVISNEGTYAIIQAPMNGIFYGVHASGNGDFNNHKVEFEIIF